MKPYCRAFWVLLATACLAAQSSRIVVGYPEQGTVFPPDFAAPTFLFRDDSSATTWSVEVKFASGARRIEVEADGHRLTVGPIDPRASAETNKPPRLSPELEGMRAWKPDEGTWAGIKNRSRTRPVTVTITGYADSGRKKAVSSGKVAIHISPDPVGAPIFYRDVPLMPSELEKGVIKPLAPAAVPLIAWRLRDVSKPESRLLMEGLHTCANCHSFSRDGKTMGMDLDGPQNDKGLYSITAVQPRMVIGTENVVSWSAFRSRFGRDLRVGFMSQVSPDGEYVVTMVDRPQAAASAEAPRAGAGRGHFYVANFRDYRFLQVFYPTRGILATYSRATGRLESLPGADDPDYVHTSAVWSPDGKYLVFARARAREPYPDGREMAREANDPNETPIQYDLYRIPFNGGKGGTAVPIAGASANGMSNSFPKVSPDGRWIVFVRSRNGLLMRPDSELYIVPAQGGEARRMRSNTPLMNSWHSFSPNGRWMVFSSKSRSPYTQMYLTHIGDGGEDTPPVLIENATLANRAVNIPEFVNIPADGLLAIDTPAVEAYRLFDSAVELSKSGRHEESIREYRRALELDPGNPEAHNNLGLALAHGGKLDEAMAHYRKALALNPDLATAHNNLGAALARSGRPGEAVEHFVLFLESNPGSVEAHGNLLRALAQAGRAGEAARLFAGLLQKHPSSAPLHNSLGVTLVWQKQGEEATREFERALEIDPKLIEARQNLADALYFHLGRTVEALNQWRELLKTAPDHIPALNNAAMIMATDPDPAIRNAAESLRLAERAARVSERRDPGVLDTLASAYASAGRFPEAMSTAARALSLAEAQGNRELVNAINAKLGFYKNGEPFLRPR